MGYIEDYVHYNRNHGSPEWYHRWCGIYTVGCALGRRVWWGDRANSPIFPNLYIILVGPQGLLYKSTCVSRARAVVDTAGVTSILADSGTKQGIMLRIKRLQIPLPRDVIRHTDVVRGAEGAFFVRELSDLLGSGKKVDDELLLWLQTWFDSRVDAEPWQYDTVVRQDDPDILYKLYISFLAGTTPRYILEKFPEGCTEQGLGSRVLWIVGKNSDARKGATSWDVEEFDALTRRLQWINRTGSGRVMLTKHAEHYLETYEEIWREKVVALEASPIGGFLARQQDYVKKLAMIRAASELPISASATSALLITAEHLEWALDELSALEPGLLQMFKNQTADVATRLALSIREDLRKHRIVVADPKGLTTTVNGLPISDLKEKYIPSVGHKYFSTAMRILYDEEWAILSDKKVKVRGYRSARRVVFLPEEE